MVDRRLLVAVAAFVLSGLSGCLGLHIGSVSGRLVDSSTGIGVAGAEIFRTYPLTQLQVIGEVGGRSGFTPDWTTSGADGEFEFPDRWVFQTGRVDHSPLVSWIHKDFGWGFVDTEKLEPTNLRIRLSRDERRVAFLRDGTGGFAYDEPCQTLDGESYRHCERLVTELAVTSEEDGS
ncbi:MAG TPA: hypothetical protein VFT98_22865, partial [Myxococcota bacterium]|nr:hypothetical protein [Myxococcota bacterium]